jgi:tetratricopeptide (TPR) repeat protein
MIMRVVIAALLCSSLAQAQLHSSDREIARKRYEMGVLLYQRGSYSESLKELQAAKAALDRPEFDYNIGLCLAKLDRPQEAAEALERFVNARPNDPEAPAIRRRIAELRTELPPPPAPQEAPPPPPPEPKEALPPPPREAGQEPVSPGEAAAKAADEWEARHPRPPQPPSPFMQFAQTPHGTATLAVGGATVALLLTSAITGGLALSNNSTYRDGCAVACDHGTYETAHNLAVATDVMISIGVAAGVTTLVLVLTRPRERPVAALTW